MTIMKTYRSRLFLGVATSVAAACAGAACEVRLG